MTANLSDGNWMPIPGYEGYYWIDRTGRVCNVEGHIIKPSVSKGGLRVELRKLGQRDKLLVSDLLDRLKLSQGGTSYENA